jgi:hypothetical protein
MVVTFVHLIKAKVPIKGTLLFCAVSDEENGGGDGVGWVGGWVMILNP